MHHVRGMKIMRIVAVTVEAIHPMKSAYKDNNVGWPREMSNTHNSCSNKANKELIVRRKELLVLENQGQKIWFRFFSSYIIFVD